MLTTTAYLFYLLISIFVTVYVSRTLSRNGLPFLVRGFDGDKEMAVATNHLLVVGFYLVNVGFVLLRMRSNTQIDTIEQLIVYQTAGIGFVLVVLGFAHIFNMYVIHQFGRKFSNTKATPANHTVGGPNRR